ncbi:helix-turn-helix domain-containing protein [Parachryseolinea silvisoli]|uniref:helix-turn-helix domain-containing protein n=1 Tax=Parachryseolinea silvisoli TaxID=2873601 RepID=UPI002265F92C|nr:response regulator transcription factor [Parachryseolinea silvisoli]MCD9017147.1 helix-turn-helix transcriptional regulator [Parachryseolinea silvisoli]
MNHFKTISAFNHASGVKPPEHPMFSILYGDKNDHWDGSVEFTADFYIIGFKQLKSGSVLYGKTKYDHDLGKMSFIKPRQLVTFKDIRLEEACCLILIHEDFLSGTALYHEIKKYHYFEYDVNEALHLSPSEEKTIWELMQTMDKEHRNNTDDYSKPIIISHLDTLLKYAQRFYKRQFINRAEMSGAVATKFNDLLAAHFDKENHRVTGLPTVGSLAAKLNLSPRYLSDLLKQETGKTALDLIHLYLIAEAKNLLIEGRLNISEISFSLGFENPNYFSRLFRRTVGITPHAFRDQGLN